ncbi:hypothetical protein [Nocardioides bruguierae]|uniref:Uncharacterized protein n=1 Tax=Nocardioides bruguierae TaxID=2945102 RepID=A0A9X2IGB3_9ACTN|nr:hypothetical protein [Nocardioides bruguierae]MCM0622716.1 hypothetical protein [Nocardioides bruguierae]
MSRIRVVNHLDDLARDTRAIGPFVARRSVGIVRDGAQAGSSLARDFARESAGRHGKHYPRSIRPETSKPFFGFGMAVYSAQYGPVASARQGWMSFENGSRNQPPHGDLAKSADIVGPALPGEVRNMLREAFWRAGQ